MRLRTWRLFAAATLTVSTIGVAGIASGETTPAQPAPTPGIGCDAGSLPETTQGRAPYGDYDSGRAALGYTCNATQVAHFGGTSGGYRVERYVDAAGHECAYYDSTLLFPATAGGQGTETTGVYAMDLTDPAKPVHTDTLRTPAMQSPHESLRLNTARGLLVADMGYPTTQPGFVDVYSVTKDCRHPELLSSTPIGILGHESGFSPDGNTYWVASLSGKTLAAIDLTEPRVPSLLWLSRDYTPHGVSISNDGNRLYMADNGNKGLTILDVSQIQARAANPQVPVVSHLTWPEVGTPQNATPFTRDGHPYLMEIDEFGSGAKIGAARIIDIADEKAPTVVSNMRLAVNQASAQGADLEKDPGNDQLFQGYQGHYCSLPSRVNPNVIACSFIMSGLRVFDIRDPLNPVEIAYFNKPLLPGKGVNPKQAGSFAMSAPAYDDETGDIWYSDGNSGFYVVRLTKGAHVNTFAKKVLLPGN
ncbi:MAG: hypothetical protein LC789_01965 [Actinobacteria bacterium]|nr:hypothetical protein [Actinomycetota bacterium]MCA1720196.1 hypothetical protein [Actinomycetota bacterium]